MFDHSKRLLRNRGAVLYPLNMVKLSGGSCSTREEGRIPRLRNLSGSMLSEVQTYTGIRPKKDCVLFHSRNCSIIEKSIFV